MSCVDCSLVAPTCIVPHPNKSQIVFRTWLRQKLANLILEQPPTAKAVNEGQGFKRPLGTAIQYCGVHKQKDIKDFYNVEVNFGFDDEIFEEL